MHKLKLDLLVLCLTSKAASVVYLFVEVSLCMMSYHMQLRRKLYFEQLWKNTV